MIRKPLNKIWTKSDWRMRPLEREQITYAAIDAYTTRLIYVQILKLHNNRVSKMEMESAVQGLLEVKAEDWAEGVVTESVKKRFDSYFVYGLNAKGDELNRMERIWKVIEECCCLLKG